jgi:hypothetical protein
MSVGSKDGRNIEAPAVVGALKGVLRENDRSHFVGLSTGKDYGKSIEGRLRVSDIGGVEGRAASELDMVFVALDNKGHNDGGSSGHVGEGESDVSGSSCRPMSYRVHENIVGRIRGCPMSSRLEIVGEVWIGGGHGGV